MRAITVLLLALTLTACASFRADTEAAQTLLVMRATYHEPAKQAGVLGIAQQQAQRLDDALASGDVERVRSTLRSMRPMYMDIYDQVDNPTPDQVAFHQRAVALWEYLERDQGDRWRDLAVLVLGQVFDRVIMP